MLKVLIILAYTNENEAKLPHRSCNDRMRMEIKVNPKTHNNYQKKTDTITTIIRKSPKFSVTKPVSKESSNEKVKLIHAGVVKG